MNFQKFLPRASARGYLNMTLKFVFRSKIQLFWTKICLYQVKYLATAPKYYIDDREECFSIFFQANEPPIWERGGRAYGCIATSCLPFIWLCPIPSLQHKLLRLQVHRFMYTYAYYLTANLQSKKTHSRARNTKGLREVAVQADNCQITRVLATRNWQWQITFGARNHFTAHCAQFWTGNFIKITYS